MTTRIEKKLDLIAKILNNFDPAYTTESPVRIRVAGALTKLSTGVLKDLYLMIITSGRR